MSNWTSETMFKKKAKNQGVQLIDEKLVERKKEDRKHNWLKREKR